MDHSIGGARVAPAPLGGAPRERAAGNASPPAAAVRPNPCRDAPASPPPPGDVRPDPCRGTPAPLPPPPDGCFGRLAATQGTPAPPAPAARVLGFRPTGTRAAPQVPYGLLAPDARAVGAALDACAQRAQAQQHARRHTRQHAWRDWIARRGPTSHDDAAAMIAAVTPGRNGRGPGYALAWSPQQRAAGAPAGGAALHIGQRSLQEDRCACDWFADGIGVAAVFDGHGHGGEGGEVAELLAGQVAATLHGELAAQAQRHGVPAARLAEPAVVQALLHGVAALQRLAHSADGAVGTMVVCDGARLWAVNLGDARSVWLPSGGAPQRLSCDHRASDAHERQLIERLDGFVRDGRLGGRLAVSRAFGDLDIGLRGIVRLPDIVRVPLGAGGRLVLGSDGVFDAVDEALLATLAAAAPTPRLLACGLVLAAGMHGSTDNKAALVLDLGGS